MVKKVKATAFNAAYLADIGTAGNDIFGKMEQETKALQEEIQRADPSKITFILIERLWDNPYQGREVMDEEELQSLTDEIKENGFLGVLVARISPKDENYYEILSGHRRKLAAKRADYFAAGTLVVWDVDVLRDEVINRYTCDDPNNPRVFHRGQLANAEPALTGWSMPVDDLFA